MQAELLTTSWTNDYPHYSQLPCVEKSAVFFIYKTKTGVVNIFTPSTITIYNIL
jgi:hypothetical protein